MKSLAGPWWSSALEIGRSRWVRVAAAGLVFALGLSLALVRMRRLPAIGQLRVSAPWVMADFLQAVYYPALSFVDGGNPYNSTVYLANYPAGVPFPAYAPATLLINLPFALLPLGAATIVYFVATIALTVLLAGLALRLAGWRVTAAAVLAVSGVVLLTRPGHWNLLLGQVAVPMVLASYLAAWFGRTSPTLGGIGLALALLKPTFGIPLVPLLLAQGARAAVIRGVGLAAALNLPMLAILVRREGGVPSFLGGFLQTQSRFLGQSHIDPLQGIWRVDLSACVSRFGGTTLGPLAQAGVALAVLGIGVWAIRRLPSADPRAGRLARGVLCCAVLLSFYHQAYDLLLLTLPAAELVAAWRSGSGSRPILFAEAGLMVVLAGNYLATESLIVALQPGPAARLALLTTNCIAMAGLIGLYLLEPARRRRPRLATIPELRLTSR